MAKRRPQERIAGSEIASNLPLKPAGHVGHRRELCWWEPIYSPELALEPEPHDWRAGRDAGPCRRFVPGSSLAAHVVPGDTFKVKDVTFRDCDFQGHFRPDTLIMFDGCRFIGCDFAYSNWRDAHFRNCSFEGCSLSLASFDRCEFRDCQWQRVGLGSKTELTRTFFNNPEPLIAATVSYRDPRDPTFRHRIYQWHRLRATRAHFLRGLMISHQTVGDEHTYYEIVRLHELQRSVARMAEDVYRLLFSRFGGRVTALLALGLHAADHIILRGFGWLNRWGESASRPCMALAACFAIFGAVYRFYSFGVLIRAPFQKSFDITFLVGYGNQTSADATLAVVQDVHAVVSIAIYSVFFATVISKLSRAR